MGEKQIGIVFDFDGTLFDDIPLTKNLLRKLAKRHKKEFTEEQIDQMEWKIFKELSQGGTKIGKLKLFLGIAKSYGVPWYKRLSFIKETINLYKTEIVKCPLVKGTEKMLKELNDIAELGLFSSTEYEDIIHRLDGRSGMLTHFGQNISTGDNVRHMKPHPEGLTNIIEKWNLPLDQIFFVGDMITDVQAGIKAGCKNIGVLTGVATSKELKKVGADYIIESVAKIPELIENFLRKK